MTEATMPSGIKVQMGIPRHWLTGAAELHDQAFNAKFKWAVPSQEQRLKLWAELINPSQVIAAFRGDDLVGILLYSTTNGSAWSRTAVVNKVFRTLGPWAATKCLAVFALFEKPLPPNRLYIEAIAVSTATRGLGIGSLLLQTAKVFAIGEKFEGLQLRVVFENSRAKALYEREGYETISHETFGFMKKIIGSAGADLMELRLKDFEA